MSGLYSYNAPKKLFQKLVKDYTALYKEPSEEGVFTVIFPLYHLREWIYPEGHESYKGKPKSDWTKEEVLHNNLYNMAEYRIVKEMCNNAKHFSDSRFGLSKRTSHLDGLRVGLGRAGDSLDVTHYLVDGVEVRDIFWPVYSAYFEYFEAQQGASVDCPTC